MEEKTRASALQELIDKYTVLASKLLKARELDLALFYRNVAAGFRLRMEKLSLAECEEELR